MSEHLHPAFHMVLGVKHRFSLCPLDPFQPRTPFLILHQLMSWDNLGCWEVITNACKILLVILAHKIICPLLSLVWGNCSGLCWTQWILPSYLLFYLHFFNGIHFFLCMSVSFIQKWFSNTIMKRIFNYFLS